MVITKDCEFSNIDDQFQKSIQLAKELYLKGSVFIYPTDTVYGFGANPFNEDAVNKINKIKGRDLGKRYILLIADIKNLQKYVEIKSERHLDFLISIWPNPVSVVLTLNEQTRKILGTQTAAFRIPNNRFCIKLLSELNMPLISTSVNKSGSRPLIEPSVIKEEFSSRVDAIFFTDKKIYFETSTLIDLNDSKPVLLREGKFKFEDILKKFN